ncbi:MAG: alpha-L-fucosidase [Pirellulales bacterium]|nr:alpha-L-fucosidase [Pirellulales bacterium]
MSVSKHNGLFYAIVFLGVLFLILTSAVSHSATAALPGETNQQIDERMRWWRDAKFGIFIHWGLYSIPAGEWNGERVPGYSSFIQKTAKISQAEYAKLQKNFNPIKYDALQWASLAKRAGAKYIVITSKHHEGFCLFDSKFTDYDVMGTPHGRDLLKPLADACRREGLHICWYYSILDWHHHEAKGQDFYSYCTFMKSQLRELLNNYGRIGVMWFDGEWIPQWKEEYGRDLEADLRRIQPDLILNDRIGRGRQITRAERRKNVDDTREFAGDFGTPEQEIPTTGISGFDWETCMTMNDTWGFKKHDHNWKTTANLIRKLVDTVSKGGNFLLNVGPTSEGLIPTASVKRLEEIGHWMDVNSESIYGTTANPFEKLPWGRATKKPGRLYLHVFDWPKDGKLEVPGLSNKVTKAYLLADKSQKSLVVSYSNGIVSIAVPLEPADPVDTVVVLEIVGTAKVL